MRTVVISWEELRKGEGTWDGIRWDEVNKNWEDIWWVEMSWDDEMRWDEMGWHDCGDSGMQWAISKRSCDEMRSDEVRTDSTRKKHGIRFQRLLLRSTGGLPVTYRHSLCSVQWVFGISNLKLPPPACPGTTCIRTYALLQVQIFLQFPVLCFEWRSLPHHSDQGKFRRLRRLRASTGCEYSIPKMAWHTEPWNDPWRFSPASLATPLQRVFLDKAPFSKAPFVKKTREWCVTVRLCKRVVVWTLGTNVHNSTPKSVHPVGMRFSGDLELCNLMQFMYDHAKSRFSGIL